MEPVGFVAGIAGLTGTFTTCVGCFEYIQLGRSFGHDYGKCLLRLDTAKLRMARWAVAVGIGPESRLINRQILSDAKSQLARNIFEQIPESFNDAVRVSKSFEEHTLMKKNNSSDLIVNDSNIDLEPKYKRLHSSVRELARRRQKETNIVKKTTGALYEKKRFDAMIDDINGFVTELTELFPASLVNQRALFAKENMLEDAVKQEMENRGHTVRDWKADSNSKLWVGDENAYGVASKGHHSSKFTVTGSADVRIGNVNRGK